MKVDITHGTAKGGEILFKKTYPSVTVHVQFSEEELHTIKTNNLGNHQIAQRRGRAGTKNGEHMEGNLAIWMLLEGPDTHAMYTPLECQQYHQEVMEGLKHLSAFFKETTKPLKNTSVEM